MQKKELPAKKAASSRQGLAYALIWLYLLFLQGLMVWLVVIGFQEGSPLVGIFSLAVTLVGIWFYGGNFLTIRSARQILSEKEDLYKLERIVKRDLQLLEVLPVRTQPWKVTFDCYLSYVRILQGDFDSAAGYLRAATESIKFPMKGHPFRAVATYDLALCMARMQEFDEARRLLDQVLKMTDDLKPKERHLLVFIFQLLGSIELEEGDFEEARNNLERADYYMKEFEAPLWMIARSWESAKVANMITRALLAAKEGKNDETDMLFDDVLKHRSSDPDSLSSLTIKPLYQLAHTLRLNGRNVEAERALQLAYSTGMRYPDHPDCIPLLEEYERLLLGCGRSDDVPDMKRWVMPVLFDSIEA